MKKYIIQTILLLACTISSCVDDKGNYTYQSADKMFPVTITVPQIEDEFVSVINGERLQLHPELGELADENKYSYLWYVFPNISDVSTDQRKDLAYTKDLDVEINLKQGDWKLCFRVTDDALGVFKEVQFYMTISSSSFSSGWYVMKANNGITDVDYFPNAIDKQPTYNMLTQLGCPLQGEPVGLAWQEYNYCHPITNEYGTTSIELLEAWHFISSHDMVVLQGGDMQILKNYEEQFYSIPEKHNPQAFYFMDTYNHQFLIDGGDLYGVLGTAYKWVGTMTPKSIGKYTQKPSEHSYYPAIIPKSWSGDVLLYDIQGKGFYRYMPSSSSSNVSSLNEFSLNGEIIQPSNLNCDIIKLSSCLDGSQTYVIMKELSTNKYRLAKMLQGGTNIFESFYEIPQDCMILNSDFIASPGSGDYVYFASGNSIYYYRDAPGLKEKEFKLLDLPVDETISNIICNSGNGGNYLLVMTSKAEQWYCYFYPILNVNQPEIGKTPDKTLTGEGIATKVMYKVW